MLASKRVENSENYRKVNERSANTALTTNACVGGSPWMGPINGGGSKQVSWWRGLLYNKYFASSPIIFSRKERKDISPLRPP